MSDIEEKTRKHQLRFKDADWKRIGESAARAGSPRNELLLRCFNDFDRTSSRRPLPEVARAKPLSTGELMLAHITVFGSEDAARTAMCATQSEWDEAIGVLPGMRAEIDRRAAVVS